MNKLRLNKICFYVTICSCLLMTAITVKADQQLVIRNSFSNNDMVLLGSAIKKFLTFRVVTVELYIADEYKKEDVLSDIPKRLEVNYHVNIPKQELYRATIKGIKQNFSEEQLKTLMPQIKQINSYYPNVKSGDQIAVTYVPGLGSQVQFNGQIKGVVPGRAFAKAFFSIWVGENPVDKQAKLKLLGKKDKRKFKG